MSNLNGRQFSTGSGPAAVLPSIKVEPPIVKPEGCGFTCSCRIPCAYFAAKWEQAFKKLALEDTNEQVSPA